VTWLEPDAEVAWSRGEGVVVSEAARERLGSPQRLFLAISELGVRLDSGLPVVGYVSSMLTGGPRRPASNDVFVSIGAAPNRSVYAVVRASRSVGETAMRALEEHGVHMVAPPQLISTGDLLRSTQSHERLTFALVSPTVVTSVIGIVCGVFANVLSLIVRRRRELAIREALGASRRSQLTLLAAGELRALMTGLVVGSALTLGATRILVGYRWDVHPSVATAAVAVGILGLAVCAAIWAAVRTLPEGSSAGLLRQGSE
jgi:hypothetical protein